MVNTVTPESPHLPSQGLRVVSKALFSAEIAKDSSSQKKESQLQSRKEDAPSANLDDRKCIRCIENDLTAPGCCRFHPFQALGTSMKECKTNGMVEEYLYTEEWVKCKEVCGKDRFAGPGCCSKPVHIYAVKQRAKSTTRRIDLEAPQMTSRFGGTDRYECNETQVREGQSRDSAEDFRTRSLNVCEYSVYYKNKQRIKESIKGIKERIGRIVAKNAVVSPGSNASQVILSDESLVSGTS